MLPTKILRCSFLRNNWIRPLHVTSSLQKSEVDESRLEVRDITKDRTEVIPVETSIRYLKSAAYKQTYGDVPVWVLYRRNHKGSIPPRKTRRTCIRGGQISTGNPCPICRDEYLVLHEENVNLLKQFVCPHTGSILSYSKTGLCQKKHEELLVMIERAWDRGLLTFDVPFRKYDYSEYYKPENKDKS
ncbi:hypothetical protein ILUMI_25051 [Ignelater luminosus]|uniref:Small ribosomal subunit protein mS40 n=1 Tax=Ignelater luminosus TaxID=2038154 RepID=A0A8K0CCE7_IGNLU|nr:hypothetical protein ILUMI_25051 [Ignelater luminosus]